MSQPLIEYFEALERLKSGRPTVVPKGTKITNDAVALEAGRGKGSIKKSRPIFADLIVAIDQVAVSQEQPERKHKEQLEKSKAEAKAYREKWEAAIGRELCLLQELFELKQEQKKPTGSNILFVRGRKPK
ncbi:MAG: hypothetical protein WCK63_04910 [Betaproteobacteria bacterium]